MAVTLNDFEYDRVFSFLTPTRTVLDVKTQPLDEQLSTDDNQIVISSLGTNNNIIELTFPTIVLLYSTNGTIDNQQLYSQPQLPASLRSAIMTTIQQTLSTLTAPLPHIQSSLRHIYLSLGNVGSGDHSYNEPDVATAYLLQQIVEVGDWQLIHDILFNPAKPVFPMVYPKSVTARMRQYNLRAYPKSLIDMYWHVNDLLNSFSWTDPNSSLANGRPALFSVETAGAQQVRTQNIWLDLPDVHFPYLT